MKYKLNPRTGHMEPVETSQDRIAKALRRDASVTQNTEWTKVDRVRENAAIAHLNGNQYLCMNLNGQWRCCGRIIDGYTISAMLRGALVDFHQAWQSGVPTRLLK